MSSATGPADATGALPGLRPAVVAPRSLAATAAFLDTDLTGTDLTGTNPTGTGTPDPAALALTGITHDSRAVRPGDLYAALPGSSAHGAQFAADAAARGAVAVLTDPAGVERLASLAGPGASGAAGAPGGLPVLVVPEPRRRLGALAAWIYGEPAADLLLLGVTGTNGKSTTTYLLEAGLRAAGHRTGLVGGVEIRVGDRSLPSIRTTPEAPDLQALFALMREQGVTAAAMEVSSHALVLGRVDGSVYDVAAFTNLSQDHLDFHADLEDYYAAKASLFTPERARRGVAVVDGGGYGERLVAGAGIPVVAVGERSGNIGGGWRAEDVRPGAAGSTFTVVTPAGERTAASVRLPGAFNVLNALLAIAALGEAGVPLDAAVAGVRDCAGVPGRMERVGAGQPFLAVVDFAHTPHAVATVLGDLRAVTAGRLIVVLGCGGDRDRGKRPAMGAAAARWADVALLTDDNPRSEDPAAIRAALAAGAREVPAAQRGEVLIVPGRADAVAEAVRRAAPGDTVAVLGKGHEQGQEVRGVVHPFDDRAVLRAALAAVTDGTAGASGAAGRPQAQPDAHRARA